MVTIRPGAQKIIVYLALTVVTLAVFWQVNHFDFVNIDDQFYVTGNNHIKFGFTPDGIRQAFKTNNDFWVPLIPLSFMLDYQIYGFNAGGYHLTNLILHILSALLLLGLFNRITGDLWKSAFVAAFFALHPLHVESVAWISERKDVLSAFFWMITLCIYVYYTQKPDVKRYLLVLFSFVLALMSKPMVVTLPIIMILLDYWPLQRYRIIIKSIKGNYLLWQLKEKMPFFILSAIFSVNTLFFTKGLSAEHLPLNARIENAPVAFVTYLEKTFWPHDMTVYYPFPDHIPLWQVFGSILLIVIISAAVIILKKRFPYLFVGWLWYSIAIAPVIGIFQTSLAAPFALTDRYHYLPSIGIAVMLAWGMPFLFRNHGMLRKTLFTAGIAFLTFMAVLAWRQCHYWKNSITLFSHTLQVTKDNALAHNNIGAALLAEGKYEEAIVHYNEALRIIPGNVLSYINRGNAYAVTGRHQRAIEDYNEAIRLQPDFILAYYNRGNLYNNLGRYRLAIENLNKAISLLPDFTIAYINRSIIYFNHGDNRMGCRDAQKACELGNCKIFDAVKSKGYCR
jgi:tetratricopeptide (TPR) repeat protein